MLEPNVRKARGTWAVLTRARWRLAGRRAARLGLGLAELLRGPSTRGCLSSRNQNVPSCLCPHAWTCAFPKTPASRPGVGVGVGRPEGGVLGPWTPIWSGLRLLSGYSLMLIPNRACVAGVC